MALKIPRHGYGELLMDNAEAEALRFFAEDQSSVDPGYELSYDERAQSAGGATAYDAVDVRVTQRGMRMARTPKRCWEWLLVSDDARRAMTALPADTLADLEEDRYAEVRLRIKAALEVFISDEPGGYRGPAFAGKLLHLRRPQLVPIFDRNVLTILGVHLADDRPAHADRVQACLRATDLIREGIIRNRPELDAICRRPWSAAKRCPRDRCPPMDGVLTGFERPLVRPVGVARRRSAAPRTRPRRGAASGPLALPPFGFSSLTDDELTLMATVSQLRDARA